MMKNLSETNTLELLQRLKRVEKTILSSFLPSNQDIIKRHNITEELSVRLIPKHSISFERYLHLIQNPACDIGTSKTDLDNYYKEILELERELSSTSLGKRMTQHT